MSPLNATVVQAARGDGSLGDFVNSTPVGWLFTFVVIAACIVYLGYRWVTRPAKKKGQ